MKRLSTVALMGAGVVSFVVYFAYLSYEPKPQSGIHTLPKAELGQRSPAVPRPTRTQRTPSQGADGAVLNKTDRQLTTENSNAARVDLDASPSAEDFYGEDGEPVATATQDYTMAEELAMPEVTSTDADVIAADASLTGNHLDTATLDQDPGSDPAANQAIPPAAVIEDRYNDATEPADDELIQVFGEQAYDERWAPDTEARINDAFESAELETSQLLEASCKSTLCRIEVSHANAEAERQFLSRFSQQPLLQGGGVAGSYQKIVDESGEIRSVFYIARQDEGPSEATQEIAQ